MHAGTFHCQKCGYKPFWGRQELLSLAFIFISVATYVAAHLAISQVFLPARVPLFSGLSFWLFLFFSFFWQHMQVI